LAAFRLALSFKAVCPKVALVGVRASSPNRDRPAFLVNVDSDVLREQVGVTDDVYFITALPPPSAPDVETLSSCFLFTARVLAQAPPLVQELSRDLGGKLAGGRCIDRTREKLGFTENRLVVEMAMLDEEAFERLRRLTAITAEPRVLALA
jgi:hypothetical protein